MRGLYFVRAGVEWGHGARSAAGCAAAALLLSCGGSSTSRFEREVAEGEGGAAGAVPADSGRAGASNFSGGSNGGGAGGSAASSNSAGGASSAGDSSGNGGFSAAGTGNGGASQGGSAGQPELDPPDCEEGVAPTPQLRRLSHAHYDRTVRDLLRVTEVDGGRPSALLATDSTSDMLTELEWEGYRVAAAKIAALVVTDETLRPNFLGCTPSDAADACWRETIVDFGRRAFRRPLTPEEVADFEALVAASAVVETSTVEALAQQLLVAFLTSPSFLLRAELAGTPDDQGRFALSPHELASRLSYLLWGSLPDPELDGAADAGALVTKEQILAQAERMLADARARERVAEFHRSYLRISPSSHWAAGGVKDAAVFPLFTAGVATAMLEEIERFFDAITFDERGSFQDFFASTLGFVNADTAPIYGLDPGAFGSELEPVSLDPLQRQGFLTRIGFLATHAGYDRTSPILRGLFVSKSVLGQEVPPPSPTAVPPLLPGDYLTNRERITALTSEADCRGCHETYINPPGFVLENYDAIGAWQTLERETGAPIDPVAGVLIDDAVVTVTDSADLSRRIAGSRSAPRAYAEAWVSFAYERPLHALDECNVSRLSYAIGKGGYPVLELVSELTQADAFRLRATN